MTPEEIATSKGADCFVFDYAHTRPTYTITFSSDNWGLYLADGSIVVGSTVAPGVDTDGVTSLAGTWTASVPLIDNTVAYKAHVHWEGTGFTVQYSVNGGTSWTTMTDDGVVSLSAGADFDLKIAFAGGVEGDTSALTSLVVYVFSTEQVISTQGARTLTFSADPLTAAGIVVDSAVAVSALNTSATLEVGAPAATGTTDPNIGTIEAWITLQSGTTVFPSLPAATFYVNGTAGAPSAGSEKHVVAVLTSRANLAFNVGPNATIRHLAVYPQQMTADEVASLYETNINGLPTIAVHDTAAISVTEPNPAVDIYAYAWSIVSGGTQ